MLGKVRKLWRLSVDSVVGNVVWCAFAAMASWILLDRTGSVHVVSEFFSDHPGEATWAFVCVFLLGLVLGLIVSHRIAIGKYRVAKSFNRKERRVLAMVFEAEDGGESFSSDVNHPDISALRHLADMGVLYYGGHRTVMGKNSECFSVASTWRNWVRKNAGRLKEEI